MIVIIVTILDIFAPKMSSKKRLPISAPHIIKILILHNPSNSNKGNGKDSKKKLNTKIEMFPSNFIAYMKRNHRWYRGDMQIISWIFRPKSGLNLLSRWKIFDNDEHRST